MSQLLEPISGLAHEYQKMIQSFVDTDKLMDVYDEELGPMDAPGALDLLRVRGEIVFQNVGSQELPFIFSNSPEGSHLACIGLLCV